jgi:glycosyltransferase involved in cell wall biosynthesis/SAM-dependent methyltransferase
LNALSDDRPPVNACTIIAPNYLPYARVLARSFLAHHPQGRFVTLVLDPDGLAATDEPFEIRGPYDIGIERREVHRMAMIYDVKELATAVKPWLLKHLLDSGVSEVMYLDPDIEIFTPLYELTELAREHSIVLTPHLTTPLPRDGLLPDELMILRAGVFNLGFIAVGESAKPFLDWWSERLRRDCLVAVEKGLFVDQRWVDLVPSFFPHYILRDPACNVAYWNVFNRDIHWADDHYEVDGKPLRFFHFSGFKPEMPHLLSAHVGDIPRSRLGRSSGVTRLCEFYADQLRQNGYEDSAIKRYAYDYLPSGAAIDPETRRRYRSALIAAEQDGRTVPFDPFDPDDETEFLDWLDGEGQSRAPRAPANGLEQKVRLLANRHPVLARAKPLWRAGRRVWRSVRLRSMVGVAGPDDEYRLCVNSRTRPGVNVVGYLHAELGIGEVARKIVRAVEHAGIGCSTIAYHRTLNRQEHPFAGDVTEALYDTNIICVNADQLRVLRRDVGRELFDGHYTIGLWFWEVSRFPDALHSAFELVDEVWVASEFVKAAIEVATPKPVFVVPLPVEQPITGPLSREQLGLPEGFLFFFSFDFLSIFERKNPIALVDAFKLAFEQDEGSVLVLKSINGDKDMFSLEKLITSASDRSDIHVIDGYVATEQQEAMMTACDCYVSLHRSEGYGLTIAEAMSHGKPAIATAYSGNLMFMHDQNSYLVPFELAEIPEGCEPYPPGVEWAAPDVEAAAGLMRHIFDHQEEARARGSQAQRELLEAHSIDRTAKFISERLAAIKEGRARSRTPHRLSVGGLSRVATRPRSESVTESGSSLHRGARRPITRRLVRRTLGPYFAEQHELNSRLMEGLRGSQQSLARVESELYAAPYMSDRLAFQTRDPAGRTTLGFDRLAQTPNTNGAYRGFEDVFRGTEEFIRERQRYYVELARSHSPVLDVGCGRGEFLELLRDAEIPARGVDSDHAMVDRCREKGLLVDEVDANAYLEMQPDDSLGMVFAAQVIEHLSYEEIIHFLETVRKKVVPGGLVVVETVNPHSISAFKMFWIDPTHRSQIFPEVAVALCRLTGFGSAYVVFPNGRGDFDHDRCTQGEYAVIASTGSTS